MLNIIDKTGAVCIQLLKSMLLFEFSAELVNCFVSLGNTANQLLPTLLCSFAFVEYFSEKSTVMELGRSVKTLVTMSFSEKVSDDIENGIKINDSAVDSLLEKKVANSASII